jgi:hypothetical protein
LFDHFVFDQIWLPRYVTLEKGLVTLYPVQKKRKKKEEEEEERERMRILEFSLFW